GVAARGLHARGDGVGGLAGGAAAFGRAREEGFRLGRLAQRVGALRGHVGEAAFGLLGFGLEPPQRLVEVAGAVARAVALALEADRLGLRGRGAAAQLGDLLLLGVQGELLFLEFGLARRATGVELGCAALVLGLLGLERFELG